MRARRRVLTLGGPALVAMLAWLVIGCGGASGGEVAETPDATATPDDTLTPDTAAGFTITDSRGVNVTIDSVERIIPLDGDVAEIVFALGMGGRVVATDLSATYPPEADALPQIGYQRSLATEPILEFEPTLLIATDIAGPPETLDELERIGVPLVVVPTEPTADGVTDKIIAVADALGVHDRGVELAGAVGQMIEAASSSRPLLDPPPRIAALYVRGTTAQLVLGRSFSTHWLIEAAGGVDVADDLDIAESETITAEALLAAAPDVLLVPAAGLESVGGIDGLLESVPALAETPAGQRRAVFSYDDQLLLGNGPRTGDMLAMLIDDLATLAEPATS